LDAPEESFVDEHRECVVHRLERDRADLAADDVGHAVHRTVRRAGDGAQDSETLGRHLNAVLPKKFGGVTHGKQRRSVY
jgi:hypothetical protein